MKEHFAIKMNLSLIQELAGSYSSKVELYRDENTQKLWVLKTVPSGDTEEIANEKYFLSQLKLNGLNTIEFQDSPFGQPNQILLEYLQDSITVGESKSEAAFELFGQQMAAMHNITFDSCFSLDSSGQKQPISWEQFILNNLDYGLERIKLKEISMTDQEIDLIIRRITSLSQKIIDTTFSLLHCDSHSNNALFVSRTQQVYLFDKGSSIVAGSPFYDLAVILIEFPHLFGIGDASGENQSLYKAFVKGYVTDFWADYPDLCRDYVLLRSIGRVGSPFNPYLVDLIRKIIAYD